MINPERIKALCHSEVFKRVPVEEVEDLSIMHERVEARSIGQVLAKGGETIVIITIEGKSHIGVALCSNSDNYCKKTGRELAFKRAIRRYWDSVKEGANGVMLK